MIFPVVHLLAASLVLATPLASEDLQPANKSSNSWACPEYGLDFYGNDITYYEDIPTWQECGKESLQIKIKGNNPLRHNKNELKS